MSGYGNYTLTQDQINEFTRLALFGYDPDINFAIACIVLFSLCAIGHLYAAWHYRNRENRYMYILGVTALAEVIGYITRIVTSNTPTVGNYVVTTLFLLMSPIALALVNYVVVGQLLKRSGESIGPLKPQHIARFFLASDILSFCVQAAGGGLLSSGQLASGTVVTLIGLIVQLVFFSVFIWITVYIQRNKKFGLSSDAALVPVFTGLYITVALLYVRNIYRVAEFAGGRSGYIFTNEWLFGVFDSLLIFISFIFYAVYHFGKLLSADQSKANKVAPMKNVSP